MGTYTDISFWLLRQAGWPVGWDWLLPGVMPIQVQAHEFNGHSLRPWNPFSTSSRPPLVAPALAPRAVGRRRLLPAGCGCRTPVRRGGGGAGGAGGGVSGVGVLHTFGILLVLELALDDLGLGATAGALKSPDVLVILVGCQDCLQLRVCDLKESGFIWVFTSTITLSY